MFGDKIRFLFGTPTVGVASSPVPFGIKICWVVVRSDDPKAVADALRLGSPRRMGWEKGVKAAYRFPTKDVFVTPPINGWVCVIGLWMDEFVEGTGIKLAELSGRFGEAHAYANHRVVGLAQWILARDGALVRSYSYLGERGEVMQDFGEPTPVELTLRPPDMPPDDWYPDEEDVMKVAAAWSFDPTALTQASGAPAFGLVGVPQR